MGEEKKPRYSPTHPHGLPLDAHRAEHGMKEHLDRALGSRQVNGGVPHVASVAILNRAGQLLIGFNRKLKVWDLVQGGVEPGEHPRAAGEREILEETGLVVPAANLAEVGVFRHVTTAFSYPFISHILLHLFDGDSSGIVNREPEKCADLYWSAPCQIPSPRGVALRTYLAIAGHTS